MPGRAAAASAVRRDLNVPRGKRALPAWGVVVQRSQVAAGATPNRRWCGQALRFVPLRRHGELRRGADRGPRATRVRRRGAGTASRLRRRGGSSAASGEAVPYGRRVRNVLPATVAVLTGCTLARQQPVTPQRPTVSFDTSTTAPGTLELETGVAVDPDDAFDSPNTLKYGTSDRGELFLGLSPYRRFVQPGDDPDGPGDLVLGTRHRLWDAGEVVPAGAVVLSGKLPTASTADGRSTGATDLRIAGVLNRQFGPVNGNLYYQFAALGDPAGGRPIAEHTATFTAGWAFAYGIGGFAELAGVFVPSLDTRSVFTNVGATWAAEPWLVFDAGCTIGLSDDAPDVVVFFGLTHSFGAPFDAR